jgi:hypothetical protein
MELLIYRNRVGDNKNHVTESTLSYTALNSICIFHINATWLSVVKTLWMSVPLDELLHVLFIMPHSVLGFHNTKK